ncbi:MAG: acetate--CoA ligase [Spirochaetales bacterium]|nr:acetate--CoA ligase [Spirochaetales bacterium]
MQSQRFYPPAHFSNAAHIKTLSEYTERYQESIQNPDAFWAREAQRLTWIRPWDTVRDVDFHDVRIRWFAGGQLNVAYNCVDRHVQRGLGQRTAIIWEGNEPGQSRKISYQELQSQIEHFAAALRGLGVKKGDRVCIFMQMIPELPVAMLACARLGAVHSVVFGAFSAESLRDRINDSCCKILITQDTGVRGNKQDIPMKAKGDLALRETPSIEKVIVVKRTGATIAMQSGRDIYLHDLLAEAPPSCPAEPMDAEDPLFILYTSGSTGKPKGVLHTTGGYLLHTALTHELVFDYRPEDIYWCTADLGWVTGHSYIIYGPLCNAATTVIYEGVPNYPDFSRFWQIIEKYKVNLFYTAPTALRALMREGDGWPGQCDLSSLRLLGSVGEPIKAPEWLWYHHMIGQGRCPIVDTWWQTETGGILISPLPGATPTKPGSATLPFFGVEPVLLDPSGKELHGEASGLLCLKSAGPGQMRTVYGDHERFKQTYFSQFPGYYFTGDGARRDEDGYYWITGRVDDVLNVSGHRIGTAEVEGAIGMTAGVAEAAVVGFPHDLKGQGIYAFVTPMQGIHGSTDLEKAIKESVRQHIGSHATPDKVQFTHGLPKTRSGKIMRRILRKIAENEPDAIGDISTLADPSVVESLIAERK